MLFILESIPLYVWGINSEEIKDEEDMITKYLISFSKWCNLFQKRNLKKEKIQVYCES